MDKDVDISLNLYQSCINEFDSKAMIQAQTFTGTERIGRVTLERFRDSIRLRWTIQGKTYSLTIGKDSRDTLKAARAKAQAIDSDITFERFDLSLEKYGKSQSTVLKVVSLIQLSRIELRLLWDKFLEDKLPHIKAINLAR